LSGAALERFNINRQFDNRAGQIRSQAGSLGQLAQLSLLNEQGRQTALAGVGGGPNQFAGFRQRGSAEAFSEILRASGVADKKAEEKKIAKSNANIESNTAAMKQALETADSLLLIPSLGGPG